MPEVAALRRQPDPKDVANFVPALQEGQQGWPAGFAKRRQQVRCAKDNLNVVVAAQLFEHRHVACAQMQMPRGALAAQPAHVCAAPAMEFERSPLFNRIAQLSVPATVLFRQVRRCGR